MIDHTDYICIYINETFPLKNIDHKVLNKMSLRECKVFSEFQVWQCQFPVGFRESWWKELPLVGQKASPLWPAGCFCVNDRLADMAVESEAVWVANTRTPY